MPARDLPNNPNLQHLKHQAKTLQETVRFGDAEATSLVREFHPRLTNIPDGAPALTAFALADAQLVVARRYGFASWPRLREHIDTVTRYTRSPHHQPIGGPITTAAELADEFLRLACLTYGGDDLTRHQRARDLLTTHPELAADSIHTAAAIGDTAAASILLATDASLANKEGGPHRCRRCCTWRTRGWTARGPIIPQWTLPGCCSATARTRTPATCGKVWRRRSPR